ncbi:WG repeat-containing protein [Aureispira]|nr:WG repeat-containing protein [Aureispira sp.]
MAQINNPFSTFMGTDCHIGLLNQENKEILPASYASISIAPIGNDWLITAIVKKQYTYFLQTEDKLITLPYNQVKILNDRLLMVGHPGAYGIVNTEGEGILLMNYEKILPAGTESAITMYKQSYGAVDLDGKPIIPNQYDQLLHWEAGGFWAYESGQFQLIDPEGLKIEGAKYDEIVIPGVGLPICAVAKKGEWGVINRQNEIVINIDYEKIKIFDNGLFTAMIKPQKWCLMGLNGKLKSKEYYEDIDGLGTKAIVVTKDGKKGLLDYQCKPLLEVKYDDLQYLGNDWVAVYKNKEVLIFSIAENIFLDLIFEDIKTSDNGQVWEGVLIKQENNWGWLDFNKNIIINPIYRNVRLNYSNTIIIENADKKIGTLNSSGRIVIPVEYTEIIPQNEYYKVKKEGTNWYYVDKKNRKVNCQVF